MNRIKQNLIMIAAFAATSIATSCNVNDNETSGSTIPDAVVTIKPVDTNSFYMQLDEKTTLKPINLKGSPYGEEEMRALVSFTEANENPAPYDKAVRVTWMDKILTKPVIIGEEVTKEDYGNDPVEIVDSWETDVEDGYITLRFRTISSNTGQKHRVNLVAENPENPYEVTFHHDAEGDLYGERMVDGLVAFRLSNLPDTQGQTVKLKLRWDSFSGPKEHEFDYCSRVE